MIRDRSIFIRVSDFREVAPRSQTCTFDKTKTEPVGTAAAFHTRQQHPHCKSLSEGTDTHTLHAHGTYHNPLLTVSV